MEKRLTVICIDQEILYLDSYTSIPPILSDKSKEKFITFTTLYFETLYDAKKIKKALIDFPELNGGIPDINYSYINNRKHYQKKYIIDLYNADIMFKKINDKLLIHKNSKINITIFTNNKITIKDISEYLVSKKIYNIAIVYVNNITDTLEYIIDGK